MRITFTPGLQSINTQPKQQPNKALQSNPKQQITKPAALKMFAYQDYNISFRGRTPEDFYAQDFNRNNMPRTMKDCLYSDYEQWQHVPPEQMMHEVFKDIKTADSFDEVKVLYPNEDLFKNLHSLSKNSRKGLLSEIKAARDLSDTPLLKDGSDDFGMYLLRKIYTEGKTLKEISKDFLEKDINDEYKGLITEAVDYSTTSAYGIKFPNNAFWHSFISTREEYKKFFVTLPKNLVSAARTGGVNHGKSSVSNSSEVSGTRSDIDKTPKPRKYKIQKFRKDQLTNDLKDSDMSDKDVERKIVRRFKKDDPEASFIVKYLSPIMVVAADRIHLSEELRAFNDSEKANGKIGDDVHMLKRFWKNNPELRKDYAIAITDTIELFEDNYGAGGLIPINNEFKQVTSETSNKKIIDYVSENFIDLIDNVKNIESERSERYRLHDELQPQWETHFNERYGDLNAANTKSIEDDDLEDELAGVLAKYPDFNPDAILEETAAQYNAQIFRLNGKNGEEIVITANLNEAFGEHLKKEAAIYPSAYARQYVNELLNNPEITDKYKLSLLTRNIKDKIDDDQIMGDEEFLDTAYSIQCMYYLEHSEQAMAASAAMADIINKELDGNAPARIYGLYVHEFNDLVKGCAAEQDITKMLLSNKKELDDRYAYYSRPMSSSETTKIELAILEQLSQYNGNNIVADNNIKEILLMLKESATTTKIKRKFLRQSFGFMIPEYKIARGLLDKSVDKEHRQARFEQVMTILIRDLLSPTLNSPILATLINRETLDKHRHGLSPEVYDRFLTIANSLQATDRKLFEYTNEEIMELDRLYKNSK